MGLTIKLATCCYCGTKTRLALSSGEARALLCDSCGAPLKRLKLLKKEAPAEERRIKRSEPARSRRGRAQEERRRQDRRGPPRKKRRRAKPRSLWRSIARELEDWVDDLEDLFD